MISGQSKEHSAENFAGEFSREIRRETRSLNPRTRPAQICSSLRRAESVAFNHIFATDRLAFATCTLFRSRDLPIIA